MVAFVKNEHLSLMLEAAEGRGVDDAVAIAAKVVTRGVGWFRLQASAARSRMRRIGCAFAGHDRHACSCELTQPESEPTYRWSWCANRVEVRPRRSVWTRM